MPTVAEKYGYTSRNAIYCEAKKRKVPIAFYALGIKSILGNVEAIKYIMLPTGGIIGPSVSFYRHYGSEIRCYVNYWIAWADALRINQGVKRAS